MGSDHDGPPGCRPAMLREGIPAGVWGQPELPSTTASSSGGGLFLDDSPQRGYLIGGGDEELNLVSAKDFRWTHSQA